MTICAYYYYPYKIVSINLPSSIRLIWTLKRPCQCYSQCNMHILNKLQKHKSTT
jgi:hypothetical protein